MYKDEQRNEGYILKKKKKNIAVNVLMLVRSHTFNIKLVGVFLYTVNWEC